MTNTMRAQKRPRYASSSSPPPQCSQNLNTEQNDEYVSVQLSMIRKELQCPICLGILRKTRTVMECLHRFCKDCIDKSMRLGDHKCPLCRIHCPSRRSLRDDPKFDALIAAICPDIDKYEKEELALDEGDGTSKKRVCFHFLKFYNDLSTDQTGIELNNSLSNRVNKGTLALGTPSSSKPIEKLLQVSKVLNAIFPNISQVVEPAGSEGEKAMKKVEELQLQVSMQRVELTRFELLTKAHEKEVDTLTEELKLSTDQVSRLDQKIAELKTTNQEKDVRLQMLGLVQNENSRLIKESEISMHKISELEQKIAELETSNKERALRLQELEQLQKYCGEEGGVECSSGSQFYNDQTGIRLNKSLTDVKKALDEALPSMLLACIYSTKAHEKRVEEHVSKKVEELQLQVSMQRVELTRFELLTKAHEKEVDTLTEELKLSTDQVSRLDQKIAELKTTNQEKDVRLQMLGLVQNENSRLIKESEISMHKISELEQKIAELETSNKERALRLQELEQLQKYCGEEGGVECSSGSQFYNDQIGIRLNKSLTDVKKALDEALPSMLLACIYSKAHEKGVEEHVSKKVEELQLQVAELTQYKILAKSHEKQVDSLSGELKMSTDQVSRLDRKITELETANQEQCERLQELGQVQVENSCLKMNLKISEQKLSGLDQKIAELETIKEEQTLRLQKLEQLQSENPQLVKECIRRLFRTEAFEDFIWMLLIPAYKYGAHHCAVSVTEHCHDISLKVFEGRGYDPTIEEELDIVRADALMNDLDFPLLHEIASLAEPLTLSTLEGLVVDENPKLQEFNEAHKQRGWFQFNEAHKRRGWFLREFDR